MALSTMSTWYFLISIAIVWASVNVSIFMTALWRLHRCIIYISCILSYNSSNSEQSHDFHKCLHHYGCTMHVSWWCAKYHARCMPSTCTYVPSCYCAYFELGHQDGWRCGRVVTFATLRQWVVLWIPAFRPTSLYAPLSTVSSKKGLLPQTGHPNWIHFMIMVASLTLPMVP